MPRIGVETSRLGFGCVQLTAHRDRRDALAILEHAFAEGITHFDVARAYGFGRSESILSKFLRGKRNQVTVATKFGLQPPTGFAGNATVIDIAKKILGPFPGLLRRAKARGAAMGKSGVFTPDSAIRSLETSLRELRTDYVDLFLLHEASVPEALFQPLIETLEKQVSAGKVRCLGIASDFGKLREHASQVPPLYQVLQFNDNAAERSLAHLTHGDERQVITHSIFKPTRPLLKAVAEHPHIAREFSKYLNVDLTDSKVIVSLLLDYALRQNDRGVVLFSSTDPRHVSANARGLETPMYDSAQSAGFLDFVQEIGNAARNGAANHPSLNPSAIESHDH